jgi:DNA helicase IV
MPRFTPEFIERQREVIADGTMIRSEYIKFADSLLPAALDEIERLKKRERTNCATIIRLRDELKKANEKIKRGNEMFSNLYSM